MLVGNTNFFRGVTAAADANRPTEPLSLATLGVMGSRHAPGTHSDVESSTRRSKFIGGLRGGP